MTVTLVVTYTDHQIGHFRVPADGGWHVDAASRCLVVGRGVPRTHIPLDSVQSFDIEHDPDVTIAEDDGALSTFVEDTTRRLDEADDRTGETWRAALPCPTCGHYTVMGYLLVDGEGKHQHTRYQCTYWPSAQEAGVDPREPGATKPCDWSGYSVPGWRDQVRDDEAEPVTEPRTLAQVRDMVNATDSTDETMYTLRLGDLRTLSNALGAIEEAVMQGGQTDTIRVKAAQRVLAP